MVQQLQSKLISINVTPHMEHNVYSEEEDLLAPIQEFYTLGFPNDPVLEKILFEMRLRKFEENGRMSIRHE